MASVAQNVVPPPPDLVWEKPVFRLLFSTGAPPFAHPVSWHNQGPVGPTHPPEYLARLNQGMAASVAQHLPSHQGPCQKQG